MENSKKNHVKSVEIEVEGKTVEEAVEKAVRQLKVAKKDLKIRVVSEEKKGLFGMEGEKPAKICVMIARKTPIHKKSN